jgi:hypothetical protein
MHIGCQHTEPLQFPWIQASAYSCQVSRTRDHTVSRPQVESEKHGGPCTDHRPQLPGVPAQHQLRVLFRQPKRNERFRNQRLTRFIDQDVCEGAGLVCDGGLLEQSGPPAGAHDDAVGGGVWLDVEQARGAVVLAEPEEGIEKRLLLSRTFKRPVVLLQKLKREGRGSAFGREEVG